MKFIVALLTLFLLFVFPQRVSTDLEHLRIYYFEICETGNATLANYIITIPSWLTVEHRAQVVFSQIFNNISPEKMVFSPQNVTILDVFFHREYAHLIVNVSAEILSYGGTTFEHYLVEKLLLNATALGQVGTFTLLIEGQPRHLPEGILLYQVQLME